MDWNALLKEAIPLLIGLATVLIGGARIYGWARIKFEVAKLDKETQTQKTEEVRLQAEAKTAEAQAAQLSIFNTMVVENNKRLERYESDNRELSLKVAQIIPLEAKVREMDLQLQLELKERDIVRDRHERELQVAEAKFEAAKIEWEGERRRLEGRIEELEKRLAAVEGVRATPKEELPAVKDEPDAA